MRPARCGNPRGPVRSERLPGVLPSPSKQVRSPRHRSSSAELRSPPIRAPEILARAHGQRCRLRLALLPGHELSAVLLSSGERSRHSAVTPPAYDNPRLTAATSTIATQEWSDLHCPPIQ